MNQNQAILQSGSGEKQKPTAPLKPHGKHKFHIDEGKKERLVIKRLIIDCINISERYSSKKVEKGSYETKK